MKSTEAAIHPTCQEKLEGLILVTNAMEPGNFFQKANVLYPTMATYSSGIDLTRYFIYDEFPQDCPF